MSKNLDPQVSVGEEDATLDINSLSKFTIPKKRKAKRGMSLVVCTECGQESVSRRASAGGSVDQWSASAVDRLVERPWAHSHASAHDQCHTGFRNMQSTVSRKHCSRGQMIISETGFAFINCLQISR